MGPDPGATPWPACGAPAARRASRRAAGAPGGAATVRCRRPAARPSRVSAHHIGSYIVDLSGYTTLRLGGPAAELVEARTDEELLAAVAERTTSGAPLLILAGGSNIVFADAGFDGTAVHVATRGVAREGDVLH